MDILSQSKVQTCSSLALAGEFSLNADSPQTNLVQLNCPALNLNRSSNKTSAFSETSLIAAAAQKVGTQIQQIIPFHP